jgi:hypothetical protein
LAAASGGAQPNIPPRPPPAGLAPLRELNDAKIESRFVLCEAVSTASASADDESRAGRITTHAVSIAMFTRSLRFERIASIFYR